MNELISAGAANTTEARSPCMPAATITGSPGGRPSTLGSVTDIWRREPESNRRRRICNPLHDHSAIAPINSGFAGRCMTTLPPRRAPSTPELRWKKERNSHGVRGAVSRDSGAGEESRTPDLNLGKVTLYQLSYSRESRPKFYGSIPLRSSRRRSPAARGARASFK